MPAIRIAIYRRVSSEDQADPGAISLSEQDRRNRAFASEHFPGSVIVREYEDHVTAKTWARPAWQRMCQDMMQPPGQCPFDVIVAWKRDRLNRNKELDGYLKTLSRMAGVRIFTVKEGEFTGKKTFGERIVESVTGDVSEEELATITERTQEGRRGRARRGKLIPSAWPKFGLLWGDPNERRGKSYYVVDEATSPTVQRIFAAIADGMPTRRLVLTLEAENVWTSARWQFERGRYELTEKRLARGARGEFHWTRQAIARIIRDPAYRGEHIIYAAQNEYYETLDSVTGLWVRRRHTTRRDLSDPARVVIEVPALVSPDLWARANAMLDRAGQDAPRTHVDHEDALLARGHVICGHCGTTMVVIRRKPPNAGIWYACRRRTAARDIVTRICPAGGSWAKAGPLDIWAWAEFKRHIEEPERLEALLRRAQEEAPENQHSALSDLAVLDAQIRDLETRQANVEAQMELVSDPDARLGVAARLDRIMAELRGARARREEVAGAEAGREANLSELEEAVNWARSWAKGDLDALSYLEKRLLLFAFGAKVTVMRGPVKGHPRAELVLDWEGLERELQHATARRGQAQAANVICDTAYSLAEK